MLVTELNTHGKIGTKCCLSSSGLMLPFRMVVTSKAATPNGRLSIFFILAGLVSFSGGGFIPPNLTTWQTRYTLPLLLFRSLLPRSYKTKYKIMLVKHNPFQKLNSSHRRILTRWVYNKNKKNLDSLQLKVWQAASQWTGRCQQKYVVRKGGARLIRPVGRLLIHTTRFAYIDLKWPTMESQPFQNV